jgi:hypothetical protein
MKFDKWISLAALIAITLSACAVEPAPFPSPQDPAGSNSQPAESTAASQPASENESTPSPAVDSSPKEPVQLFPTESPTVPEELLTGETPQSILDMILADAVKNTATDLQNIEIIRSQAVTWPDGSLGCPQQGMAYIQVLIEGYWVVLKIDGLEYDYRVSDNGNFILCKDSLQPEILPENQPDQPNDRVDE